MIAAQAPTFWSVDLRSNQGARMMSRVPTRAMIQFSALADLECWRERSALKVHPNLQSIADGFKENVRRVLDLGVLPGRMFAAGHGYCKAEDAIDAKRAEVEWKDLTDAERNTQFDTLLFEFITKHSDFYASPVDRSWSKYPPEVEMIFDTNFGEHVVTLLQSMIVAMWTGFEVMAGDLWERGANARPDNVLDELAKGEKANAGDKTSKDKRMIKINLVDLKESGCNLHGAIGKHFKSNFGFLKYNEIAGAFRVLVGSTLPTFESDVNRSVFDLAQMRNVIVHSAGLADDPFLDAMVRIANPIQELVGLEIDQPVPINGKMVTKILGGAIESSLALIKDVDAWAYRT
jgi:hypothetical protein